MYTEILSNTNRESIQVLWTNRQFGKIPKKELHRNTEQHEPGEHSGALDE
jgi:hypothetical protein